MSNGRSGLWWRHEPQCEKTAIEDHEAFEDEADKDGWSGIVGSIELQMKCVTPTLGFRCKRSWHKVEPIRSSRSRSRRKRKKDWKETERKSAIFKMFACFHLIQSNVTIILYCVDGILRSGFISWSDHLETAFSIIVQVIGFYCRNLNI